MNRRGQRSHLVSSRRSVVFSPLDDGEDAALLARGYSHAYYPYLLAEDVASGILPYRHSRRSIPYRIRLLPEDQDVEREVANALARDQYGGAPDDLADSLSDFAHDCAQVIMTWGEAVYEVVYWSDPKTSRAVSFGVRLVTPGSVQRQHGRVVQQVPESIARHLGVSSPIDLDPDHALVIGPPRHLQGGFRPMLEILARADAMGVIAAAMREAGKPQRLALDPMTRIRGEHVEVARATREIGWNARGMVGEHADQFYVVKRQLRFEKFRCHLRNHIVSNLNDALLRIGQHMEFEAQIILEGLPTAEDIERAEEQLERGEISLNKALEPFLRL